MRLFSLFLIALGLCAGCGPRAASTDAAPEATAPIEAESAMFEEASSIDFTHQIEQPDAYFMPDIMGSGAALFDMDGDDDLDALLMHGVTSSDGPKAKAGSRLFRQDSGGAFVDVTKPSGIIDAGYGMGAAVGDVDNDGDRDLYVTAYGPDQLWLNDGRGVFTDATAAAGIRDARWGTAASFFDYDRDGWLDLIVVNYVDYHPGSQCEDPAGRADYCGPTSFTGSDDHLFRNLGGDGQGVRFADVTVESGISAKPGKGLGVLCADFNGDDLPDIFVANDMEPNFLWIQQPGGRFREQAELHGVAVNGLGLAEANMGVAWGDVDGDSLDDLFVTHLRGESNTLFRGGEFGVFVDGTAASGLGPPSLPFTGFGVAALDVENDGDLDYLVVNGRVKRAPPAPGANLSPFWNDYAETNQLFLNDGKGRFRDASSRTGLFAQRMGVARALAYGDLDNDGDLDALVSNCGGPARVYDNRGAKGGWLGIRLLDPSLGRDAIGARVTVRAGGRDFRRQCNPAASYLASHDDRLHFGIGEARSYEEVVVRWIDGSEESFPGGEADRYLVLRKGEGTPKNGRGAP